MKGLDSAAFNAGDIGSGHGRRTIQRTGSPAQPSHAVMADGRTDRGEDEIGRQVRQQRFDRLTDGGMAGRRGVRWLIKCRIVGIYLGDGFDPARGIALAEHPREVRLHQAVIVDGLSGHLLRSG